MERSSCDPPLVSLQSPPNLARPLAGFFFFARRRAADPAQGPTRHSTRVTRAPASRGVERKRNNTPPASQRDAHMAGWPAAVHRVWVARIARPPLGECERDTMAKHTKEQREYIVRALASFVPAQDIAARFQEQWRDTTCTVEDVAALDPKFGAILSPDLHAEFAAMRERVLTDPNAAPFAAQAARLVVLSQQAADYHARKDYPNVRAVFRQIAEETGDVGNGKTGKAAAAPAGKDSEPVTTIERVVVYPPEVPADQKVRD